MQLKNHVTLQTPKFWGYYWRMIIFTKYLPCRLHRRLPGHTMGQMGSLHKAHHHRMRKDQCSWALPSCTDICLFHIPWCNGTWWDEEQHPGRVATDHHWMPFIWIKRKPHNLILFWSLSRWYALDEVPFSRVHPKPASEGSLGFGIISFFYTIAW